MRCAAKLKKNQGMTGTFVVQSSREFKVQSPWFKLGIGNDGLVPIV